MAVAHGVMANNNNTTAKRNWKGGMAFSPSMAACEVATPKIKMGIAKGKTKIAINTPPRLAPRTKAAAIIPSINNPKVPMASASITIAIPASGKASIMPKRGAVKVSGSPINSQAAAILVNTVKGRGAGIIKR